MSGAYHWSCCCSTGFEIGYYSKYDNGIKGIVENAVLRTNTVYPELGVVNIGGSIPQGDGIFIFCTIASATVSHTDIVPFANACAEWLGGGGHRRVFMVGFENSIYGQYQNADADAFGAIIGCDCSMGTITSASSLRKFSAVNTMDTLMTGIEIYPTYTTWETRKPGKVIGGDWLALGETYVEHEQFTALAATKNAQIIYSSCSDPLRWNDYQLIINMINYWQ